MTEKQLETQILDFLSYLPSGYFFKVNNTGLYDPTKKVFRKNMNKHIPLGVADILGCYKGVFVAMEVKLPSNKKRPQEQIDFINVINKGGGVAGFVTSISEAHSLIEEITKEQNKGVLDYE